MANPRTSIVAGILILGVAALIFVWWGAGDDMLSPSISEADETIASAAPPQLDCVFYKFTAQRPHLEFVFDVAGEPGSPRFEHRYVALFNGQERTVDMKEAPYPVWTFESADEPKRLSAQIDVVDNSLQGTHTEPVTIELYNYNPIANGSAWKEASLKSIHYQNLPGQCRQAMPQDSPAG